MEKLHTARARGHTGSRLTVTALLLAASGAIAGAITCAVAGVARAGVVNPNISVIGQPIARWNDDPADPQRKRPVFDVGETEMVFDDYLNPYARGYFTLSLTQDGLDLEEGYFTIFRGLPAGLALKGGKYRAGFGKLNPEHPHTYPFVDRFHVLATYLPGDESLNETGVQLSERIPSPGETSVTASLDWLRGDTFRIQRTDSGAADDPLTSDAAGDRADEPRPATLGRLSAFLPVVNDRSGLELGLSGVTGTNNVAAAARTTVWGGDAKLKLWVSDRSYLLVQGEALKLHRDDAAWVAGAGYTKTTVDPFGFYLFADYNWNLRWYAGASYERYQQPTVDKLADQSIGAFAGFSVMEETTLFTLAWEHFMPGTPSGGLAAPPDVNTVSFRIIYSMGPHKAHQF